MLSLFNVILPVFALVALGFAAVRFKFFPAESIRGLIMFVNIFAAPVLLFRAMLNVDFGAVFDLRLLASFYIGAISVFVIGMFIARQFFKQSPGHSVANGFAAMFSNTVLLGIPIVERAYGAEAMPIIYSIIGFHAPLLITLGIFVMEFSRRDGSGIGSTVKQAGRSVIANPLLIGILLGMLGNLINLELPEPAEAFTILMSQAVAPVALFGLGGALNEYRLRDNWRLAAILAGLKIFGHPFIAWVLLVPVLNVPHEIARYVVLLAAISTGINAYIFANTFKRSEDIAANVILISTVSAVVSLSFWLFVLSL